MKINLYEIECPYCSHKKGNVGIWETSLINGDKTFITCNSEEGGCDKTFVATIQIKHTANTIKLEQPNE